MLPAVADANRHKQTIRTIHLWHPPKNGALEIMGNKEQAVCASASPLRKCVYGNIHCAGGGISITSAKKLE